MNLSSISEYLESYNGRDRIMRTLYYLAQYAAGVAGSKETAAKLNSFSEQISSCRTVLRLFDDIPMLCYTMSYGLGRKEPDKMLKVCNVAVNALDQLYYPFEHVAWAADCKLLSFKSDKWWTASSLCWSLSMFLSIFKSIRYLKILRNMRKHLENKEQNNLIRLTIPELTYLELNELLTAARCLLDCIHAIHWLTPGFLWAGKMKQWQIGALGFMSSLISLYQS